MNKLSKKLVSAALTATTVVWMSGVFLLMPVASAQTASTIQAQINQLLAQIQQLQAQLATQTGGTSSYSYTRDLTVGSKGADVSALQQVLITGGYLKVAATGYFGSLTKAAVAAWQKASGLSPAAGYFGPKSRAFLNSAAATTPTTTGTPSTSTSTPPVTAPATGLQVSLASDNPTTGSLIAGSSRDKVLAVNFTAGASGPATITEIKVHKTGTISDSQVSGAYLSEGGKVLSQYSSISSGVIDFAGLNLVVAAGQTREFRFSIDPSSGVTAGNTVYFSINGPNDVNSTDQSGNLIVETGAFPLTGNIFTAASVSSPSIASLTVTTSSIATTVTAGTTGNIVGSWNFSVSNNRTYLNTLKLYIIGSATKTDVKNVKLYVNGSQVGSALATVASDGTAYFDLTSAPATLSTGSNNVQVYADVMGSPSYNFQFEILNGYDILNVDSQYNVPVLTTLTSGVDALVTIQAGTAVISQYSGTPTANVAAGQSNITLAQFTLYAGGEAVKVKFLDFKLTFVNPSSSGAATISTQAKNVTLTDDAGGQVGTTINTPPTSNTCTANSTAAYSSSTGVYADCFGTSASPINYIVPANTTRVLSLKADLPTTASFTTVTGSLVSESGNNNVQGLTSNALNSSGGASGAALTLTSAVLTVAKNNAVGSPNISANSSGVKIGSYAFTASTADSVTINSVTIQTGSTGSGLANLKVLIGGSQFGTTQPTIANTTSYSYSGSFTVPKGGTTNVDVYADLLSTATSMSPATTLTACSGYGTTSLTTVSCSSTAGQGFTTGVQSTVTLAADTTAPAAGQIVMGSLQQPVAAFRFTETSNVENVKITNLNVIDAVSATSSVKAAFANLTVYNGATSLGTANTPTASQSSTAWIYTFNFGAPVVVPQANSLTLTLKGDVASFASSGATDNTTHVFKIATTTDSNNSTTALTVIALGASSNASSSVSGVPASANTQTVLRTKLTVTAPGTTPSGVGKSSVNNFATLTFSANSAGAAAINTITVTFGGSGPSSTNFLSGVDLLDVNSNSVMGTTGVTSSTNPSGNSNGTGSITVTASSTSATNVTSSVVIGGVTVTTALSATGTPALADAIARAVNASTSVLSGGVTAATSSNSVGLVTLTASVNQTVAAGTLPAGMTETTTNITGAGNCTGSNTCSKAWNFGLANAGWTITAGSSYTFTLRVDDTKTLTSSGNSATVLSATINANTDITWTDGLDSVASSSINLPTNAVPVLIKTVTYAVGT